MSKKKILVLTDKMPWGHRSIAKAILGYLKPVAEKNNWIVDYDEVELQFKVANELYVLIYRFWPQIGKVNLKMMENELLRKAFVEVLDSDLPNLVEKMEEYQPDLVISTYFMHSHALVKWRRDKRKSFQLWNVVADPWTINPVSFVSGAEKNLVYDEKGEKLATRLGIDKSRVVKTGWWVRKEMYRDELSSQSYRDKVRKKLGFSNDMPVVFVGGGSLGTSSIAKLFPALLLVKREIGIIFNSGTDKMMFGMVERFSKLVKKLKLNKTIRIANLGWVEDMGEVLSVCDLVFGKAGPNFLFDVVAVGKPLVAITHVGGQEDGNLELIEKKKLGWVREKLTQPVDFLLKYADKPEKYNHKFDLSIAEEAENNRQTEKKIVELVKKVLE
jgi:UDP-N-acetylglucosamine:LPS N-acetylglucosamine transferase